MAFKNAIKILFNTFELLWVLMLYFLVCLTLILSLAIAALQPLLGAISSLNLNENISSAVGLILTGEEIGVGITSIVEKVKELVEIFDSPSNYFISYLFIVLIVGFIGRFIVNLYEAPLVDVIASNMSSKLKAKFSGCYISKLGKSTRMTLFKMLFVIPYDFVLWGTIYWLFDILDWGALRLLTPFAVSIVFIVGYSIKFSAFCFIMPEYITSGNSLIASFKKGFKDAIKNFSQVFTCMILAFTTIVMLNIFFGLFTFGAGLIITIPLSMIFLNLIGMTLYYEINNKRYYLDEDTIYIPRQKTNNF